MEDGVTVSTTVAVEKATDFCCFAGGGGDTTMDVRRRLRQQLVMWQLSLEVGAAAEVLASMLLADEEVVGSASALRWKGLAAQPAIGEIIGEADEKLLGAEVDDGDRDVLLPPATWRNVAAPANVCGRRLVFLVTHMLRCCDSSRIHQIVVQRQEALRQALCSIISHTDSSLFTRGRCAVFALSLFFVAACRVFGLFGRRNDFQSLFSGREYFGIR